MIYEIPTISEVRSAVKRSKTGTHHFGVWVDREQNRDGVPSYWVRVTRVGGTDDRGEPFDSLRYEVLYGPPALYGGVPWNVSNLHWQTAVAGLCGYALAVWNR